ncbi:hypothetical protein CDD81_3672 [Ophiocordyceps australis]|uniref:Uncharacterized protein n=1 Tax=Ophiocordyceps australis TaxID=1399860 RepID=A0A2C5XVP9_9HYPO|nr:hypothetical protein CDD81_3672 [Ophiocordyceps australis]
MKASILFYSVLIGLASSHPAKILARQGPPGATEGEVEQVIGDGYKRYGPSGFDYALTKKPIEAGFSNNGKDIGSLPESQGDGRIPTANRPSTIPFNPDPNRPSSNGQPLSNEGDGRIPSKNRPSTVQFNPDPNQRLMSNLRTTCLKRGLGLCGQPTQAIKSSSTWKSLQAASSRRVRITGSQGGKIAAFTALAPYAHDVLDTVKSWDNAIAASVKWFEDSMASLEEYIGGPQVPEIHGNELKLRMICWFRGVQRHKNAVDEACDRLREKDRLEEVEKNRPQKGIEMVQGLNQVIKTCEYAVDNPPLDGKILADLAERCNDLLGEAFQVEGWAKTLEQNKPVEKPPFIACALFDKFFFQNASPKKQKAGSKGVEETNKAEIWLPPWFKGPARAWGDYIDPSDDDCDPTYAPYEECARLRYDAQEQKTWDELGWVDA